MFDPSELECASTLRMLLVASWALDQGVLSIVIGVGANRKLGALESFGSYSSVRLSIS
jgi:hypothetical protein